MTHKFTPTDTMKRFMTDNQYVRLLAGPIGGGKSVCCTHELVHWASSQQPDKTGLRRTKFLVIRNTRDQLMSTTWKTVTEWLRPGTPGIDWKATEKTLTIHAALPDKTVVHSEWMFLPLDEPSDIRKALSLEATGIWINEWRELHPEIVDGLLSRTNRFPPPKDGTPITRAGGIFDTNMPDEETWHWEKMENPPENWSVHIQPPAILDREEFIATHNKDPDGEMFQAADGQALCGPIKGYDGTEWFINPSADNLRFLNSGYYPNNVPGKKEDFVRVFLQCKYGRSLNGVPVYDRTFKPSFHISPTSLEPIRSSGYPITIGLDAGRTPAAVFMQTDTRGRVLVLDELTSENMGIETFINTLLKPRIQERFYNIPILVAPDPAAWQKSQVNEMSVADVLMKNGFKLQRPPTNQPELRIQAVERLLLRQIDGKAAFIVDARCDKLIKGFRYGYKYKLDKKGVMNDKSPEKNSSSHVHDAAQYSSLVVDLGLSGAFMGSQKRAVKSVGSGGWT